MASRALAADYSRGADQVSARPAGLGRPALPRAATPGAGVKVGAAAPGRAGSRGSRGTWAGPGRLGTGISLARSAGFFAYDGGALLAPGWPRSSRAVRQHRFAAAACAPLRSAPHGSAAARPLPLPLP